MTKLVICGSQSNRLANHKALITELEKHKIYFSEEELYQLKKAMAELSNAGIRAAEAGKALRQAMLSLTLEDGIINKGDNFIQNEKKPGKFIKETKSQLRNRMKNLR